jgi:hypothetical protein
MKIPLCELRHGIIMCRSGRSSNELQFVISEMRDRVFIVFHCE